MQLSTVTRADFPRLVTPGIVVWRPVYEGRAQPVKVIRPTNTKNPNMASNVFVLPYSEPNLIYEPQVSWYSGRDLPRGIVCFLKTLRGEPLHALPDNWYGLQIIKNAPNYFVGTPLTCPDISVYESFRVELASMFAEPSRAVTLRFSVAPELPRMFVRPIRVEVGDSDLEVARF